MIQRLALVSLVLLFLSSVAGASDELVSQPPNVEPAIETAVANEASNPSVAVVTEGEKFLPAESEEETPWLSTKLNLSGSSCQIETCDFSWECWEGCGLQWGSISEGEEYGENFCW